MRSTCLGLLLGGLLSILTTVPAVGAASATASGGGTVRTSGGGAIFTVEHSDTRPLSFTLTDTATDPARQFTMGEPASVDCLGEMFGGQTLRLTGLSSDSAAPGQFVTLQVFLVDGGPQGPDQVSVKATAPDASVIYFLPLRALQSGELVLSCAP